MLAWVRNHLDDLKPEDFYKEFDYSYNVRKQAEEKLQELLSTIKEDNNSKNSRKAKRLLNTFESWTTSVSCENYWLKLEASLTKAAHQVAGRRAAYNTINTYTKIVHEDDEAFLSSVREHGQAVSEPVGLSDTNEEMPPRSHIDEDSRNNPFLNSAISSKRLKSSETETTFDSDTSWQSENENAEYASSDGSPDKKQFKAKLYWFVGPGEIETILPEDACQWFVNEVNVSALFFEYRKLSIKKASTDSMETPSEMLAINNIFLLEDSGDHNIDQQLRDDIFDQMRQEYLLEELSNDSLLKCNEMAKVARTNFKECKAILRRWRRASDEDETILDVFHNILGHYTTSFSVENFNEDTFVHEVLQPIISPFFQNTDVVTCEWANGTFGASSERKRKFDPFLQGRKADFSVYVSNGYHRQPLLVSEVKPPRNSRSSRRDDLLKLGNEMKDAIDKIIHNGVEEDVAICGLLVEGCRCTLFVMDLRYHAVYRMFQLGIFYLPRDRHNFRVLTDAFEVLHQAQAIIKQSAQRCLACFRTLPATPKTTSRHAMMRSSFHTPMKVPLLSTKKDGLFLRDQDIKVFEDNWVAGRAFLNLTAEKLADLIRDIKG
ncbi:360_t:CDS:10, partial [Paraglomus occultum]